MAAFLTESEEKEIIASISEAEKQTSGEIRVHIESKCKGDPLARAVEVFDKLGMLATKDRNGVLIYIAVNDKKLAIIGDKGIDEVVPEDFWKSARDFMTHEFSQGAFAKGIIGALKISAEQLQTFFPFKSEDRDELSNDISLGD